MLNDLRHAARMLFNAKGWTAVVVISLALGIGANTALFSAANGLLFRKVAVRDADHLVRLRNAGKNDMVTDSSDYGFTGAGDSGRYTRATFSYPMFRQLVADNKTMTELLACAPFGRVNVGVSGQSESATAFIATGNYFQMLNATANPGRIFTPEDDQPGAPPVAVISTAFWHSRFGSDPSVVGKVIAVNTVPITIVGVISPDFTGIQQALQQAPDVTMPLSVDPLLTPDEKRLEKPTYWWLQVMGRLKPGATASQVEGNLGEVFRQTARSGFEAYLGSLSDQERSTADVQRRSEIPRLIVASGSRGIYDANSNDTRAIAVLSGVVGLVLLLVCANVANLLLARATMRQKEVSVRLSLGATRGRLIRQLLTESVLLASMGGGLGLVIGQWGKRLLPGTPGQATPIDWRVMAFVATVTLLTAIVFGMLPAIRSTAINVNGALKQNNRSVVASRTMLAKSLLVMQVGISLVLLIGAGLFLRTVENLRNVDIGFNPRNLVLFRVNPQLNRYDAEHTASLYRQILDELGSVGGVRAVAASQPALLSGSVSGTSIFVQGRTYALDHRDDINRLIASPGFFKLMEMPVMLGRGFTERDNSAAPKVALINETAAKKFFPNDNPIGQHFGSSVETSGTYEIVGVLHDTKYNSMRDAVPPTMYLPHLQRPMLTPSFVVRTAGEPMSSVSGIREAVRKIDPNLPILNVTTQMEQIELRIAQEKLFAQAYALFGGLALLVAAVGLFGLMSYSVARRTNEIGVRMALGARPQDVLQLVLGESMTLVVIGVVLGVAVALGAGRLVATLLFGVQTTDVVTMALAVIVLVAVAAFAGYLPARRAARVDPMVALHDE